MRVIVAGGTGFIGQHLCRELVARDHAVTALSRSPDTAELPPGVETAAADVTVPSGLEEPLAGADAVVNLVALSPLFRPSDGEQRHQEVHLEGTRQLVRAAAAAEVPRFVQLSGLGADPNGPTAHLRAKGRAEGLLTASDRQWVILRPSVVFGDGDEFFSFLDLLTTPYLTALPGGGRTRFQLLWVRDLVEMIADAVVDEGHVGQRYDLGGPEALTLADITRAYYHAQDLPVRILPIPMPLARVGLTLAGPLPLVPFGADQYWGLQVDQSISDNDVTAFGRQPGELQTVEAYLAERFGGG